jgi:hypothetical protein
MGPRERVRAAASRGQSLALVYKLARGAPATASAGVAVTPPPGGPHGAFARLRRVAAVARHGHRRAGRAPAGPRCGVHLREVVRDAPYESLTLHHLENQPLATHALGLGAYRGVAG